MALVIFGVIKLTEEPKDRLKGWGALVFVFLAFVTTLAYAITQDESLRLCQRGHEEYQLRGKTMQRIWVCDER